MMRLTVQTALLILAVLVPACGGPEPDRSPPDAPLGLIVAPGDGRAVLSWTPSLAGDLDYYRVWYRLEAATTHVLADSTTRTDTIVAGLENGLTHYFSVTALDEAGNQSERSREVSATPYNEVVLTAEGWTDWEAGEYAAATGKFQAALNLDSDHAPAYTGLGWTLLKLNDIATAASRFTAALSRNPNDLDARAGGLIAYRELSTGLNQARNHGSYLLNLDPAYVFSHDRNVDADLIRLVLAQVYFLSGPDYHAAAQDLLDVLVPGNGLDPAVPASWSVQGTAFSSYPAALLALLACAASL